MPRKRRSAWLPIILVGTLTGSVAVTSAQDPPPAAPPAQAPTAPPAEPPPAPTAPTAPSTPPSAETPPPEAPPAEAPPAEPAPTAAPDLRVTEVPESTGIPEQEAVVAEADAAAATDKPAEEMVVTGSRIRRKDLTGPAPVVVFSREQVLQSGRANVGEFLQTLPQQSNAINRGTNNAGDGSVRINLRGLGAQSTLVLLNGRRLSPGGTGGDYSPDLTAVPTNIVERIEVLTDGASAVYGSDAIAGVVNIITRKRYDGAEVNAYGSTSTRGDGQQIDVNGVVGVAGEKGNLLVSMGYYNAWPAWAGDRDYSREQYQLNFQPDGSQLVTPLGSGTIPNGRFILPNGEIGVQNGNPSYNRLVRTFPVNSLTYDRSMNGWRDFQGASLAKDGYNFQPYNYLVTPQERFNIFSSGDYQLSKYVRVFFDSYYTKRNSKQTLAPEPLLLDDANVVVAADSLYNPFGRDFAIFRRRLVEFGRRKQQQDVNNFHLTAGVDGELSENGPLAGWFWEAVFNYNRNEATQIYQGNIRTTRLQSAVGPSFVDAAGVPRCGTPGSIIDGCVPLNVFGGPGSITQDQIDYLTFTGVWQGYNQMISGQFNTSGPLFRLAAKRPVSIAAGYEYRVLSGGQIPDPITVAHETSGNSGLPTEGSYKVNELYAELSVPIAEKLPFLDTLELVAAARGSWYSNFGSTFNYKLGARWSPVEDVTLRGTFSTAFRAPNIQELYGGVSDTFANVTDPCASGVEAGTERARNCGAAANNGEDKTQLRSRVGGNPKLDPETARIFTAGLVLRPRNAKNLSITVDYFNTKVEKTIASIGENVILQSCYPNAAGQAPKFCEYITRDPLTQRITYMDNLKANTGTELLDGIDFAGQYDLDTSAGSFNFHGALSYLHRYDRTLADGQVIKGAGTFDLNSKGIVGSGVGGAFPHFRFNAGIGWGMSGFTAGLRTHFIGSYKECGDTDGELIGAGLCYTPDHVGERWVSAYNTWDLVLGYTFKTTAGQTTVTLGSTNIFDVEPPRVYNGFANTTDTYTYDMLMRQVYARVGHQF